MTQRNPRINANILAQPRDFTIAQSLPLIIAQKTASGSATANTLITDVTNNTEEIKALFGDNSSLAIAVREYKLKNKVTSLSVIAVDDAGGATSATGSITFSGTPSDNGTFTIRVGSYRNNIYQIPVSTTSTPTSLGDALETAINADKFSPVTASNTTGTVTLTASNAGTVGNNIYIGSEGSVTGVTVTLVAMSGGATDPVITTALDLIDDKKYDIISVIGKDAILTQLDSKFNSDNAILDGRLFTCITETYSNFLTALAGLRSRNGVYFGQKTIALSDFVGSSNRELDLVIATRFAALRNLRFIDNQSISSFMSPPNNRGGLSLAVIPYFNMVFDDFAPIPEGYNFLSDEITEIENEGGSVLLMNDARTQVITNTVPLTAWDSDNITDENSTFHYLNDIDSYTIYRQVLFNFLKSGNYRQAGLAVGNQRPVPNVNIQSESTIKSGVLEVHQQLADIGIANNSFESFKDFKDTLIVTIDGTTSTVSISCQPLINGQLRQINIDITPKKQI